jgi:hypothetical protein
LSEVSFRSHRFFPFPVTNIGIQTFKVYIPMTENSLAQTCMRVAG